MPCSIATVSVAAGLYIATVVGSDGIASVVPVCGAITTRQYSVPLVGVTSRAATTASAVSGLVPVSVQLRPVAPNVVALTYGSRLSLTRTIAGDGSYWMTLPIIWEPMPVVLAVANVKRSTSLMMSGTFVCCSV